MLFSKIVSTVGNGFASRPDDIKNVRKALIQIGYEDKNPEFELIDQALDRNIKSFQKDNTLKSDGRIEPDGETERKLQERIHTKELAEKEHWGKVGKLAGKKISSNIVKIKPFKYIGQQVGGFIGENFGKGLYIIKDKITKSEEEKALDDFLKNR